MIVGGPPTQVPPCRSTPTAPSTRSRTPRPGRRSPTPATRLAWGRVISDWNRNHEAYGGEAFQRYQKISDRAPRR